MKARKPLRLTASADTPYKIGYGKPPVASRFKPGQSGNPKGRPEHHSSNQSVLEDTLRRKVRIVENGIEQRLETVEVLFRSLVNRAIKGDYRATQLLLQLMEKWNVAPPQQRITEIRRIIVGER